METLVINPVKRKRRRRTPKKVTRRRRRNPVSTKGLFSGVVYTFIGLTAAVMLAKTIKIERKWIIGLVGAGMTLTFGKKLLKKNTVPVAVGFGLASAMNLASKTTWLKGTFSDYVGCPCSMTDYPVMAPGQGYGYAPIDASTPMDYLAEGYSDYFLDPSRGGVTTKQLMFNDSY